MKIGLSPIKVLVASLLVFGAVQAKAENPYMVDYEISLAPSGEGKLFGTDSLFVFLCSDKPAADTCSLIEELSLKPEKGDSNMPVKDVVKTVSVSTLMKSMLESGKKASLSGATLAVALLDIRKIDKYSPKFTVATIPLAQIPPREKPTVLPMSITRNWERDSSTSLAIGYTLKLRNKGLDGMVNMPRHLYRPSIVKAINGIKAEEEMLLGYILPMEVIYFSRMDDPTWKTLNVPMAAFGETQRKAIQALRADPGVQEILKSSADVNFQRYLGYYYLRLEDVAIYAREDAEKIQAPNPANGPVYASDLAQVMAAERNARAMQQAIGFAAAGMGAIVGDIIRSLR